MIGQTFTCIVNNLIDKIALVIKIYGFLGTHVS